ncbi:MAG: DNA-processing protein DprA [Pseudomonadota bacterium]
MVKGGNSSSHPPLSPISEEENLFSCLRLLRSRRVGVATYTRLLSEHKTAQAALEALPEMARAAGIEGYAPCPERMIAGEFKAAKRAKARLVAKGTPSYPAALAEIADAPPLIWMRGTAPQSEGRAVALVGARNASSLGTRMAKRLAHELGQGGYTTVSGLARGIDTVVHQASLETGTIAVLAGGVDVTYPPENAALMAQIAEKGALVSEMPMGLQPQARHFPRRNRLISGVARAVVVIEAAARSGSLITAEIALDQGRDVLAVPGHPFDARAAGCLRLIRDGATLLRSVEDIFELLGTADEARADATPAMGDQKSPSHATNAGSARANTPQSATRDAMLPPPLREIAALHRQIIERLGPSPMAEDQLIRDTGTSAEHVSSALVDLEIDGKIERQAGGLLALKTG